MTTDIDLAIPHSVEAEQSVIGSILISTEAIDEIATLRPEHFYVAAHREIYRLALEMSKRGAQIDVITLAEAIQDAGLDDVTGGLAYLGELASNTPGARNVKRYAEIVQSKAIERQLLAAVEEIRAVVQAHGPTKDKLNTAQTLIMAVAELRQQRAPRRVSEALGDYMATMEERFSSGDRIRGLRTHLAELDNRLGGLKDGNLIIVAGRPSMGKSAFTNTIAVNVAGDGHPVAIMSMEMTEVEQIDRMIATLGHVPLDAVLAGDLSGDAGDKIQVGFGKLNELPIIIDEEGGLSVHEVMSKARQIKRKHGLKLLIVDALGLMDYDATRAVSELGAITRTFKAFAKEMNVPIILLCQLSRKVEDRNDKRPIMSDLRDSGNIEQDADVIIMLYRDEYYRPDTPDKGVAEVLIRKARQGRVGVVPMAFLGEQTRFADLGREWSPPDVSGATSAKAAKGFKP